MAKPYGPVCNLDCAYCFYRYKKDQLGKDHNWRMDYETLEIFVRDYISSQPKGYPVQFVWQGGEPSLLGLDFFRQAVELQKRYKKPSQEITNAFQTNAILIDDKWAAFFKENNFLVGVSIDGPKDIHDHYRVDSRKKGSFDRVMDGVENLRKYNVDHNALVCVTDISSKDPLHVYSFLKKNFDFIQFIPVVEEKGFKRKAPFLKDTKKWVINKGKKHSDLVTSWSTTPEGYGIFLNKIFDEWVRYDVGRVFVQIFDTTLANWMGYPPTLCIFNKTCGRALVLEHNGDIYACDHFVYPEYRIGNIKERNLAELAQVPSQLRFGRDKWNRLPRQCLKCEYLHLCFGGCPKNRFIFTKDGKEELNYLCKGYSAFFEHTSQAMGFMANELSNHRSPANIMERFG
ncbi:MAG: anaerobic sulfatase maturase [Deltaproteobacteria bacterium]|nr:anaerobic sulfatase maturase [Deltaproteobacteria bacterium]